MEPALAGFGPATRFTVSTRVVGEPPLKHQEPEAAGFDILGNPTVTKPPMGAVVPAGE